MLIRFRLAAALTVSVLVAGCGSSNGAATSASSSLTSAAASSSSVRSAGSTVSSAGSAGRSAAVSSAGVSPVTQPAAPAPPARIVSLSPTATEDLFAIGAGKQVVAVDNESNYPSTVPKTDLSAYKPNVEAIAKFKPDLVVLSDDINNIKAELTKLSIPVVVEPAATTLNEAYQEIQSLGTATGHTAEATKTVSTMRSAIAAIVATVPKNVKPLTYYHELDNTLYTVSSKTFVGQIYTLAGLKDVADSANAAGTAYPQLSAEYLVKANPDLVFLADTKCCQQNAARFGARPGFSVLSAVKNKHIVLLDDDVASRWGPRVVQFLQQVVEAVKSSRTS